MRKNALFTLGLLAVAALSAQVPHRTPAQALDRNFTNLNQKIVTMAEDFPEDKYDYRPAPGLRSFGEVILHITTGNIYAAKAGRGENVKWDDLELNPKNYKGKAAIVAALKQSVSDATTTLKGTPESQFAGSLGPWLAVIEHGAEHYGQLVVYYRNNGLVPPESRKGS